MTERERDGQLKLLFEKQRQLTIQFKEKENGKTNTL